MKVRIDYVSNSSSSSYIVFGTKVASKDSESCVAYGTEFSLPGVEDFNTLAEDECFFLVLAQGGSEGDYLIPLSPELIMDCDMHGINLNLAAKRGNRVLRAKYIVSEDSVVYEAKFFAQMRGTADYFDSDKYTELKRKFKNGEIILDGLRPFSIEID